MQVPGATKLTVNPSAPTVQIVVVDDATDTVPSPLVDTAAVKLPPNTAAPGRFVTDGTDGAARPTLNDCPVPVAAR